jgi:hypothetical protein
MYVKINELPTKIQLDNFPSFLDCTISPDFSQAINRILHQVYIHTAIVIIHNYASLLITSRSVEYLGEVARGRSRDALVSRNVKMLSESNRVAKMLRWNKQSFTVQRHVLFRAVVLTKQ